MTLFGPRSVDLTLCNRRWRDAVRFPIAGVPGPIQVHLYVAIAFRLDEKYQIGYRSNIHLGGRT
jgi:hypothetical protein